MTMYAMRTLAVSVALGLALAAPAVGAAKSPEHPAKPRTGRVIKQHDGALKIRKLPGRTKYGNITLKRGFIAAPKIAEWRRSLRPLLKRPNMRGMSRREAALAQKTYRQAKSLDVLLHRWQRWAMHFERLKAQRDAAARRGRNTALLDRRMDEMLREIHTIQETLRNRRQMASTAFQNFDQKANQLYNLQASIVRTINESRRNTIRHMQ